MRSAALIVIVLMALAACGREMPDENPSCCLYECEGPRVQWFSEYFGDEDTCQQLAGSRCALEFPEQPGLRRYTYEGAVSYDESKDLNMVCAERFVAFEAGAP